MVVAMFKYSRISGIVLLHILARWEDFIWGNSYIVSRHVAEYRICRFRIPPSISSTRNVATYRTIAVIVNACESKYLCTSEQCHNFSDGISGVREEEEEEKEKEKKKEGEREIFSLWYKNSYSKGSANACACHRDILLRRQSLKVSYFCRNMKIYFQRQGYVCQEHSGRYASGSVHILSLLAALTSTYYIFFNIIRIQFEYV